MTVWIIPESDREGRAVCQSWLPGGKHNVTPTNPSGESHPGDPLTPPPPIVAKNKIFKKRYLITRKRFSEKPIVAFTKSTIFILDFNILLSEFGLMFWP